MAETLRQTRPLYRAAIALVLAAVAIDTVIWGIACHRLEQGARDAALAAGWTLSSGPAGWGGWPVAAEITLPGAVLRAGPDIIPPLTWTAARARIRVSALHPTVAIANPSGAQSLALGAAPPVPFTAQTLTATLDLTGHDPVRLAATALDVAAPAGPVTVAAATLAVLPDGLSADLAGITLTDPNGQPVTPPIDAFRIDGRITPPVEPQPTAAESAQRWRDHDGKLDLGAVSLRWGPLDATGRATLTLDRALQPVIAGQITATGLAAVIDRLAQTGAVTRSSATAAQAMLTILAAPTGGGPVTLPITLRDGIVAVARIPLLRLLPLRWD